MLKGYCACYLQKLASPWLVLSLDLTLVAITFFVAHLIQFNFTLNFDINLFFKTIPFILIISCISFLSTRSFKCVIRYTGLKDVITLFKAVILILAISIIGVFLNRVINFTASLSIPPALIIIHALLNLVVLSSYRLFFKTIYGHLKDKPLLAKHILIYGIGDSALKVYNALKNNTEQHFSIEAFIADGVVKKGLKIEGLPVITKDKITSHFILKKSITEIFVAHSNRYNSELLKLADNLPYVNIKNYRTPFKKAWVNTEIVAQQVKPIQIEDVLGRPPIEIDNPKILDEFKDQIVLVTGAAGSIGSELVNRLSNFDLKHLILIDQAESPLYNVQQLLYNNGKKNFTVIVADIRDAKGLDDIFSSHKPTIIFHAAAYKHVGLMEKSPYEAIKINVNGTKLLANAAIRYQVKKFVLVSTDKAVNPTSVMGATKRMAEMYISCLQKVSATKFITTRFGNVLGSNGSVFQLFQKQIVRGSHITLTHPEITRYFMTISEASQLMFEAATMGKGGEIFLFDMGASVKIFDLAKKMIKLSGLRYPEDIDINIIGLRPGEKLFEEVLANEENTIATYHKKILISKTRRLDYNHVKQEIEDICTANILNRGDIVQRMKALIPEYKSNNSQFEKYDKKVAELKPKAIDY